MQRVQLLNYLIAAHRILAPARRNGNAGIARALFDWGVDAIVTDRLDLIPPEFR